MKMGIAVAIIVIAVLATSIIWFTSINNPKSTPIVNPSKSTPTPTPLESTPTPSPQPSIVITYNTTFVQQIGNEIDPPAIHFLIVNMTITNNGYSFFDTNRDWFYFTGSDGISYQWDMNATGHGYSWTTLDNLSNGSTISGTIVCQVPSTVTSVLGLTYRYNDNLVIKAN